MPHASQLVSLCPQVLAFLVVRPFVRSFLRSHMQQVTSVRRQLVALLWPKQNSIDILYGTLRQRRRTGMCRLVHRPATTTQIAQVAAQSATRVAGRACATAKMCAQQVSRATVTCRTCTQKFVRSLNEHNCN